MTAGELPGGNTASWVEVITVLTVLMPFLSTILITWLGWATTSLFCTCKDMTAHTSNLISQLITIEIFDVVQIFSSMIQDTHIVLRPFRTQYDLRRASGSRSTIAFVTGCRQLDLSQVIDSHHQRNFRHCNCTLSCARAQGKVHSFRMSQRQDDGWTCLHWIDINASSWV